MAIFFNKTIVCYNKMEYFIMIVIILHCPVTQRNTEMVLFGNVKNWFKSYLRLTQLPGILSSADSPIGSFPYLLYQKCYAHSTTYSSWSRNTE